MSDVGASGHRARSRAGRGCLPPLVALLVVVGGAVFVVWQGAGVVEGWFADDPAADFDGRGNGSVRVEVLEGDTAADIGATLERQGVVASVEAFTDAATADPRSTGIQPGVYQLQEQMSAHAALTSLIETRPDTGPGLTIPEGLTVAETIALVAEETDIRLDALRRASRDDRALGLPAYADGDPEGYLFPSTYPLDKETTAADVLGAMVDQFNEEAVGLSLEDQAAEGDISPAEAVIVASLVQAEARRAQDFGKVARVVYNRLDVGQALELDSTVKYFTGSPGVATTDEERATPSPYNTYLNPGLPPTPIEAPGTAALEAALDPTPGDWAYFVTVNVETGRTLFAEDYDEHLKNRARYLRYCDENPDVCG